MKKMKKIFALLLAFTMILGMTMTASAANAVDGIVGNEGDEGTITVLGIEEKDATVTAYKIVEAEYDATTKVFKNYNPLVEIDDIENPTADELAAIDTTKLTGYQLQYDSATNSYSKDVPVGMYLIKIDQVEVTQYADAVVSVYYSNDDQIENEIEDGTLTMTTSIEDGVAWVKKTVEVNVEKTVDDVAGTTANIGDNKNYVVAIDPIPSYSGQYPVLKVTDVMSDGLTYNDDVVVYVVETTEQEVEGEIVTTKTEVATLTAGTNYTATFDEDTNTLVVNFVLEEEVEGETVKTYTLNEYAGKVVEIRYSAEVDVDALLNGGENNNTVLLDYTKDSTIDGDDASDNDETHVYTFDIDGQIDGNLTEKILTKIEESTSTTKTPLAEAEFTLYTNATCTTQYTNGMHSSGWVTTSDDNGKFKLQGLAEGTYYFKETKAPDGYSLNTHVYKIVIDATIDEETGVLEKWDITIDDNTTSTFEMTTNGPTETKTGTVDIPNTKLVNLPSTGGIGTTIFTVAGCGIMIAAAFFFFASRRKENK